MNNPEYSPETDFNKKLNHDLRACFSAINGFQAILKEEIPNLSEAHKNYLDRIEKRCEEAGQIIDDLYEILKTD